MHFTAGLSTGAGPADLLTWVDDLTMYPQWLSLVASVAAEDSSSGAAEAWKVELRARVGPLARSKRLRMVRTKVSEHGAVFERHESDGRSHSAWVLRADVVATEAGSDLIMTLEAEFGVEFDLAEATTMRSVSDIQTALRRHGCRV
jgi:hypothetical protein